MEKAKILVVYNLLNANGDKLQLRLGTVRESMTREDAANGDNGFRWSFVGRKIPMPVRAYTWFNGFTEETMMSWLNGNGWHLHTRVDVINFKAKVYELPKANELPDDFGTAIGTRFDLNEDLTGAVCKVNEEAFHYAIRELWNNGHKLKAVRLYRYANGGSLGYATEKVKAICGEK